MRTFQTEAPAAEAEEEMKRKPKYVWDDLYGVAHIGKEGQFRQAIQLLIGPASRTFRRECGELLVDALNRKSTPPRRDK